MFYLFGICALHIVAGLVISGRVFRPQNRTEHLLLAGLLAYSTFYLVPLTTGWITGLMNVYVLAIGLAAALIGAAAAWYWGRGRTSQLWHIKTITLRPWGEWIVWAVTILILLLLFTAGLVLPARFCDAPSYHMANPMRWHQTGKFILDSFGPLALSDQMISAECAPNVKAIWGFAVLLLTRDMSGTALAQFPFVLLLAVTARALALRLGTAGWLASIASLVSIVVPEIVLQSLDAYADVIFAAGQIVLVWSLVYLWQNPFGWRSIAIPAFGFAILYGAKSAALVIGGVIGLLYGILLIWKTWKAHKWQAPAWIVAAFVITLGAICVSGGPWYYHAWKEFGNPVFPYALELKGKTIFPGPMSTSVNQSMLMAYTGASGLQAYWNTLREVWRIPAFASWSGGLGAGMFIIGIPALVLFFIGAAMPGHGAGSRRIFVLSFLALTLATPTLAIARFSLFQPVMGAIAFAWLATIMPLVTRIFAVLIALAAAGYDFYMAVPSIQVLRKPPELLAFHILSGFDRGALVDTYPDQYTALDYWKEEVSGPGKKLAIHGTEIELWFTYAPWSPADTIRVRAPKGPDEVKDWHQDLLLAGVTHLYMKRTEPAWEHVVARPDLFPVLMRRLDGHWAIKINSNYVYTFPEDALFAVAGANLD